MDGKNSAGQAGIRHILDGDEVRDVLRDTFYSNKPTRRAKTIEKPAPEHYEIICISLYKDDLKRLDEKVSELKKSGHRRMSRSALIRYALDTADLASLPRGY